MTVAIILALATVYFGTSKLGFTMAFAAEQVTLVWPPTGISLAAVLLLGYRVWPGIALGAFLANVTAHEPVATACGIAIGNTLEALSGVWMLHRLAGFDNHISRLKDVLALVFLSAFVSTAISATIGVMSLCIGGVQPWTAYGYLWLLWWLGDLGGALIIAPMLLVWGSGPFNLPSAPNIREALILATLLLLACLSIFTGQITAGIRGDAFIYVVFPFIIWAALRFGQHGTTFVSMTASAIAIWATLHGLGPFTATSVEQSLMLLQIFMAVVTTTGLFLGTAITERKQASEARALLAAIVEFSEDAIISETLDGVITSWNRRAEHMFGHTAAEAIGRPITIIIPPERHEEETHILNRLRNKEHIEHYETVRMTVDGRKLDVSLTISPILGAQGRIIGASKVIRDITERKRTDKALREADRRKDEFLALLAHELRNPLGALQNALYIMQTPNAGDAKRSGALEIMARQLQQITRLVDDLLDVSRISNGKIELRRERIQLARIIDNALETVKPLMEARMHRLTIHLPESAVWFDADPVRLSQVFANLLQNAAKYTPPGGKIRLTAETDGQTAQIHVRDTGIGIPTVMLSKIFELFTQVDNSMERTQGGMGIGLTLVKTLVEMHHGSVEVQSKGMNQGSEFVVRLPQVMPPQITEVLTPALGMQEADSTSRRLRILVVDDSEALAQTLGYMAELLGHEVRVAHNGEDALTIARSFLPEVVLLDLGLPGMNGFDVCRKLRTDPALRHSTIIAQSGWGQPEYRERSKESGFDYHLVKPVKIEQLEELFSSLA